MGHRRLNEGIAGGRSVFYALQKPCVLCLPSYSVESKVTFEATAVVYGEFLDEPVPEVHNACERLPSLVEGWSECHREVSVDEGLDECPNRTRHQR